MTAYLNRLATALPPYDVHDKFVRFAPGLLADSRARRLFGRMAERCGIEHRWSFFAPDPGDGIDRDGFYRRGAFPGTAERMAFYERRAEDLAVAAVAGLEIDATGITHLVVASCTGFSAPGLDLQLMRRFGMPDRLERTMVGFMGCHAAIHVLRLARHIVRSDPSARVLVVALELCTLHLQDTPDLETVLSFLIFGDGCAAGLVTAEPGGLALDGFASAVLPDTAGQITWRIGAQGFDMHLAGAVPASLAAGLPAVLPRLLGGRRREEIALWAVHPGGRSVLDAVEQALRLPAEALRDSREVLRQCGNMSSASVLFVLERMLARGGDEETAATGCAMAFGPGLAAEAMTFHRAG